MILIRAKKTKSKPVKQLSHPIGQRLKLLRHAHSGRLVHGSNTSHALLLILLVITGFFVFIGYNIASAGSVHIGLIVPGPPPADGAVITSPQDGDSFKEGSIVVEGTCARNTTVVVYSNAVLAGSTLCSLSLTFQLQIQLFTGANSLTALNFDALAQAGPITPTVNVTYASPEPPGTPSTPVPVYPVPVPSGLTPTPPSNCNIHPDATACHLAYINSKTCDGYVYDGKLPASRDVRIAIICISGAADIPGDPTIGILVWGGHPPYALSINWGDGSDPILKSVDKPGYFTVQRNYAKRGNYVIRISGSDSRGQQAYTQATVAVSGPAGAPNFVQYVSRSLSAPWFDTPVPTYLLAVAVVLGFWAGDYFERALLKAKQSVRSIRKKPRRRHA